MAVNLLVAAAPGTVSERLRCNPAKSNTWDAEAIADGTHVGDKVNVYVSGHADGSAMQIFGTITLASVKAPGGTTVIAGMMDMEGPFTFVQMEADAGNTDPVNGQVEFSA